MLLHLVGILSSRFAHDARSQEHKNSQKRLVLQRKIFGILLLACEIREDFSKIVLLT